MKTHFNDNTNAVTLPNFIDLVALLSPIVAACKKYILEERYNKVIRSKIDNLGVVAGKIEKYHIYFPRKRVF